MEGSCRPRRCPGPHPAVHPRLGSSACRTCTSRPCVRQNPILGDPCAPLQPPSLQIKMLNPLSSSVPRKGAACCSSKQERRAVPGQAWQRRRARHTRQQGPFLPSCLTGHSVQQGTSGHAAPPHRPLQQRPLHVGSQRPGRLRQEEHKLKLSLYNLMQPHCKFKTERGTRDAAQCGGPRFTPQYPGRKEKSKLYLKPRTISRHTYQSPRSGTPLASGAHSGKEG